MKITMDMSSYEIEKDEVEAEYSDDILYTGWNPEVDSMREQLQPIPAAEPQEMPVDITPEAMEIFLKKMYSYQR